MADRIYEAFLEAQFQEGMALAAASDVLGLFPLDGPPPQHYIAVFRCKGLVRTPPGEPAETDHFEVGIYFPPDYLRRAEPFEVLTWLGPRQVFHPNISDRAPVICIGRLVPGTSLADVLYQVFEMITYQKVTPREDDALNREACAWVRQNPQRFPVDPRPLKRRKIELTVEAPCPGP